MGIIQDYEPVVGCTKHGPCEGCRLDDLEDAIEKIRENLEELHDAQRAAGGDSGNPRSGDIT